MHRISLEVEMENKSMDDKQKERKRRKRLAAYNWARKQMEKYCPDPNYYNIKGMDRFKQKKNYSHVSVFRGLSMDPPIIRVYWYDTDSFLYSIINNYNECFVCAPEIMMELEDEGIAVYEKEMGFN